MYIAFYVKISINKKVKEKWAISKLGHENMFYLTVNLWNNSNQKECNKK